jgi:hypothetical protein
MARPCDGCGKRNFKPAPVIRGELIGSNLCNTAGFTVTSAAPVPALCRTLLAAGFNPDQSVEIYRGAILALRVRAIGQAARLAVADGKTGRPTFRRWRNRPARDGAGPPVEGMAPEGAEIGARR